MCGSSRPWASINGSSESSSTVSPSATTRPPSSTITLEQSSTTISRSWVAMSLVAGISRSRVLRSLRPRGSSSTRGLVHHQDPGVAGQQTRQADAAHLAAAQVVRGSALESLQSDPPQRLRHQGAELLTAETELGRAEGDVLEHGGAEELVVGILEEQADGAADLMESVPRDGTAEDAHGGDSCRLSGRMPLRCRRRVDFPAPLGPMRPTLSPSEMVKETSWRAAVPSSYR